MTESENKLAAATETKAISSYLSIGNFTQVIAIAIALSYICGFIIVTAYLGSFGIKDYETFRTQYIVSGATLFLISGLFYYFIGRHARTLDEDTNRYTELFAEHGAKGKFWGIVAALYNVSELGFFIAVATVIATSLLFTVPSTRVIPLLIPMVFGFYWNHIVITSKAAASVGGLFFLLVALFYFLSFVSFYYLADGIISSFLNFFLFGALITLIATDTLKSISAATRKIYLAFLPIFVLVIASGAFGRYFYGHVRSSIGGGEPEQVQVVIDKSNTPKILQEKLKISGEMSSKIDLIAETDSEIFLGFPMSDPAQGYKTIIRIDRKLIKAIISSDLLLIHYMKTE